jgi:hypothetical protein
MTQTMTEVLQTGAELSFIAPWANLAFHGSGFVFQNPVVRDHNEMTDGDADQDNAKLNYGIQLGFGQISDQFGWDVGVGYLYDLTGVNDVGYAVSQFDGTFGGEDAINSGGVYGSYHDRVGGINAYGMINSGPFSATLRYAAALQRFNVTSLSDPDDDGDGIAEVDGAKPWTADVTLGYAFNYYGYGQNIYLGYQSSGQAQNLYLPRSRWQVGYGVSVFKNTDLIVEYDHDNEYGSDTVDGNDDDHGNSNKFALRLAVKFG